MREDENSDTGVRTRPDPRTQAEEPLIGSLQTAFIYLFIYVVYFIYLFFYFSFILRPFSRGWNQRRIKRRGHDTVWMEIKDKW